MTCHRSLEEESVSELASLEGVEFAREVTPVVVCSSLSSNVRASDHDHICTRRVSPMPDSARY